MDDDMLIRELARHWRDGANQPLTQEQLQQAEARLGFTLPRLLRRFYCEIGNGCRQLDGEGSKSIIGPDLFPLTVPGDSMRGEIISVVAWYRGLRDDGPSDEQRAELAATGDPWPELPDHLLMFADWGCNIYSLVDCSRPALPIFRNDNNVSLATFAVEAPSLHEWLERWLGGENLVALDWERAEKVTFVGDDAG